jgi:Flp pilus assembly protein TadD
MAADGVQAKIDRFTQLVAKQPESELARYSLGSALFEAGRFAEAEPEFARALAKKSDWVMAYIFRARCLIRLGRVAEARPLLATGRAHSIAQQHESPVEEIDEILADLG